MSKIAIFSDLHLGSSRDSTEQLAEAVKVVEFITKKSSELGVRKIAFLGDYYHNRIFINVLTQNIGIKLITYLKNHFESIYFIGGNHDYFYKQTQNVHSLKFLDLITDSKIQLVTKTDSIEIDDKKILFVPWLGVIPAVDQKYDVILTHANTEVDTIKHFFAKLKNIELEKIDDDTVNSYLFNNETVDTASIITDSAELVNTTKFKVKHLFDLLNDTGIIFSGHFHMRDEFERFGKRFIWIGAPLELTWADEKNVKGFYILDVATLQTQFFENTFSPQHKTVLYSTIQNLTDLEIEETLKSNLNNYLKIVFDIPVQYEARAKIYSLVQRFGNVAKIEIDSALNQTGLLTLKDVETIHPLANKFEHIRQFVETLKPEEFTSRNIDKLRLLELLKHYYVRAME